MDEKKIDRRKFNGGKSFNGGRPKKSINKKHVTIFVSAPLENIEKKGGIEEVKKFFRKYLKVN